MKAVIASLTVASVALAFLFARMIDLGRADPLVRRIRIALPSLPHGTPSIRIVLLSDFHVSVLDDTPETLRRTVARVNALHPDIVLLAGDFLAMSMPGASTRLPIRPSITPLAGLRSSYGVFAVLGNQDVPRPRLVARMLRMAGIRVLNNDAAEVGPLALVGISDAFSGKADIDRSMRATRRLNGTPIVFTHSPDVIPLLPSRIRLVMAGHTHCGQISLPLWGPLITESRWGRRYSCGIVREGPRTSVISAGLGTSRLPLRLGAPPDFWVIDVSAGPPEGRETGGGREAGPATNGHKIPGH